MTELTNSENIVTGSKSGLKRKKVVNMFLLFLYLEIKITNVWLICVSKGLQHSAFYLICDFNPQRSPKKENRQKAIKNVCVSPFE